MRGRRRDLVNNLFVAAVSLLFAACLSDPITLRSPARSLFGFVDVIESTTSG